MRIDCFNSFYSQSRYEYYQRNYFALQKNRNFLTPHTCGETVIIEYYTFITSLVLFIHLALEADALSIL